MANYDKKQPIVFDEAHHGVHLSGGWLRSIEMASAGVDVPLAPIVVNLHMLPRPEGQTRDL